LTSYAKIPPKNDWKVEEWYYALVFLHILEVWQKDYYFFFKWLLDH